jgi:anti-anti-sigma regulatory factor
MTVTAGPCSSTEPPSGSRRNPAVVAARPPDGDLSVWTDQSANRCVLRLRGRLCADTVSLLDRHVDRLGCRWCDRVTVDLRRLDHLDPVGAKLLVGLGHYVVGRGGQFDLEGVPAAMDPVIRAAAAEVG